MTKFGKSWDDDEGIDRQTMRDHWPLLGNMGVMPLLKTKRTERAIENEAYRLGLKRIDKDGKPVRGRGRKPRDRSDRVRVKVDPAAPLAACASFGYIPGGPVASVFNLASAIGGKP